MKNNMLFITMVFVLGLFVAPGYAIYDTIPIQGTLTNTTNYALEGIYDFSFNIYDVYTSGTSLYESNQTLTTNSDGVYTLVLPSMYLNFTTDLYLDIVVNDTQLNPRINISSVGTAKRANETDNFNGLTSGQYLNDTDFGTSGIMKSDGAGIYSILIDASTNWNTAYSWGNHSVAGYLIDVLSANNYITVSGTTNKTITFSEAELNNSIDTKISEQVTTYSAATVTNTTGTLDSGNLASVQTIDDDDSYNVSEVTGVPGFDISFNFTGVEHFNQLGLNSWYSGSPSHQIDIQIYDYSASMWDTFGIIESGSEFIFEHIAVTNDEDYISGGVVQARLYHATSGVGTHDIYIDFIDVQYDTSSASITDHGQLSGKSDDDHTQYVLADGTRAVTGNWNQGVYNFTNTDSWWLGKVGWDTIQNKFITAVNGNYINMVSTTATFNDTKMNQTIDLRATVINSTMKTYVDAQDTSFNTTLKSYLDAQDISFNSSLLTYIDGKDTTFNNSIKAYLDAQDISFNSSLLTYIDGKDTTFNTSIKNYADGTFAVLGYGDDWNKSYADTLYADISVVDTSANTICSGTTTYLDGEGTCDDLSSVYQPLEATLTDIADGTINENLVNTANPWANNEVVEDLTINSTNNITSSAGIVLGVNVKIYLGNGGYMYANETTLVMGMD